MPALNPKDVLVALVRGPIVFAKGAINNEATPAIGFAYLAGYLRNKGYQTTIVDAIAEGLNQFHDLDSYPNFAIQGLSIERLVESIPAEANVIGFSCMFSGEWPVVRDLIKACRKSHPNALFVAGGEHVTALPEYSLQDCDAIDVIVKGEGERTFHDIVDAYTTGSSFEEISGICYKDAEHEFRDNGALVRIREIDEIPWPYWPEDYLEKFWAAGKSHGVLTERDMPMLASRGCPYRCAFCSSPQMWTTRYILREVDDLLKEIQHYIDRFQITSVQFYDLTAIMKKPWIMEFCTKLLDRGIDIKWSLPAGTRSEVLDHETLKYVSDTGCNYLVYAPESGSPETLERIGKRIQLPVITKSMRIAKSLGLVLRANMIIGFPHERRRDIFKTLLYGIKLSWFGIDEVPLFIFSAYPGTQIFKGLVENDIVELNDEYFFSLASLNSDFLSLGARSYNPNLPNWELAMYRIIFMLLNYLVGYIRYPQRIVRTFSNIIRGGHAATVFEHRLRDAFTRIKARA